MVQSVSTLHRLFYCSLQTPAVAADVESVVSQIIRSSIRNNREVGITGLLVLVQGHFIQVLEGKVDAVRNTYASISMDVRHSDPHIVSQGPADRRLFSDWNMCARSLAPSDDAIIDVLDSRGALNPRALTPTAIERLLTRVAEIQRRTALAALVG